MAANYNWSEFNPDLLAEIAKRVKLYDDFISFGEVCRSWRSAAVLKNFRYKSNQIPWLMLPPEKDSTGEKKDVCSFFSLSKGMSRRIMVPDVDSAKYFSSRGWLIKVAPDFSASLLHPFAGLQHKLPDITTFPNWDEYESTPQFANSLFKCALEEGSDSQPRLMVIYGQFGKLGYARPGDQVWRTVNAPHGRFFDVIYYKNQFYAVNTTGKIFAIKGDTSQQVAALPDGLTREEFPAENLYLVELDDGRLLMVSREGQQVRATEPDSEDETYGTFGFQVFEVDLDGNKWKEIKNLGGRSLFLGHNSSVSIDASNNPHCKPNCIYFTDDFPESYWNVEDDFFEPYWNMGGEHNGEGGKDTGVYNMEDGSIQPHFNGESFHRLNPPMWVEQSF